MDPGGYPQNVRALAKAYESQRERIADLEDDVERLRPKGKFEPVKLFDYDSGNTKVLIDTDVGGGICIDTTDLATEAEVITVLTKEQGIKLAKSLAEWAGLSVVEWRRVDDDIAPHIKGMYLTSSDGYVSSAVCYGHDNIVAMMPPCKIEHYAPLPKPPTE